MPHLHFQQPISNELVDLQPLKFEDFDALFAVASDPLIWEQHPNPNRYQRPVFFFFFAGHWHLRELIWHWTSLQARW